MNTDDQTTEYALDLLDTVSFPFGALNKFYTFLENFDLEMEEKEDGNR